MTSGRAGSRTADSATASAQQRPPLWRGLRNWLPERGRANAQMIPQGGEIKRHAMVRVATQPLVEIYVDFSSTLRPYLNFMMLTLARLMCACA